MKELEIISTPEEIVKCLAQPDVYIARTSRGWYSENVSYRLVRKTKDVEEVIPVINEQLIERTCLDLGTSGRLNARKHEEGTPGDADYRITLYCFLYDEEQYDEEQTITAKSPMDINDMVRLIGKHRFEYIDLARSQIIYCIPAGGGYAYVIGHRHDAAYEWVVQRSSSLLWSNIGYSITESALRDAIIVAGNDTNVEAKAEESIGGRKPFRKEKR